MADNDGEENNSRGNGWEVVSLTASAYEAAPNVKESESTDENKSNLYEAETSHALFMSRHFVFPPNQHENLPLEPDKSEIHDDQGGKENVDSDSTAVDGGKSSRKNEDVLNIERLGETDEFSGIDKTTEKGGKLSFHGDEFSENTTLPDLNLVDKEQDPFDAPTYSSFHGETNLSSMTNDEIPPLESNDQVSNPESLETHTLDSKSNKSNLPCGAWWKRRAVNLYSHAKEANAFWSIFVAAAVMGLVILGQRWQQESWRTLQLKGHISVNDQKTIRVLGPITRLKDVIVGGQRRGSSIKFSPSEL
ncbi:ATG8-interacting protein 1-like isoform X1 [Cucurbita moschata]|uniref:ATG8-interacting protein 1-like isoform X1 n=1 Tax=Cucurbita moschata TaxID=3662 RepID=A0A6J1EF42_CUCMO|nr:ATG8-interacting protein 1-like isoform X1 [Cucurbita moschata]XP_022924471.1 ATG8-interacting protein 1-like isoform X1 [Cucurbita moschata]XP_022924472.1 ATG8-interacting protein 1-like isoform X1 [Cucurbita moschata]